MIGYLLLPFLFLLLFSFVCYAGEPIHNVESPYMLDTVVVTADKRETDIQDTPVSVSVVGEKQIEDENIQSVTEALTLVPNVAITKTGPKGTATTFASVRGISASMGNSPVLGIYIDDVYYNNLDMSLLDIDHIEVLRGPQGTLYGRNTEAGVINIITKKPGNEWRSKIGGGYSSYNTRELNATTSGYIFENSLGLRAAMKYEASDGYFKNKHTGDKDVSAFENFDGRFRLNGSPTSRFNYDISFDLQNYRSSGFAEFAPFDSANLRKSVDVNYDGQAWKQNYVGAIRWEYNWDKVALMSVSSLTKDRSVWDNDTDFTPIDLYRIKGYYNTTNFSQELRLLSKDKESPLQWLFGAFGFYEEGDQTFNTRMNMDNMGMPGFGAGTIRNHGEIDTTGMALFGQGTYTFFEDWGLTMGLRYDRLKRKIKYDMNMGWLGPIFMTPDKEGDNAKTFTAWLPKLALSYRINKNIKPYISASRGFREGGYNITDAIGTSYKSEYTWNYEIGAKTQWLDNSLTVNATLFWIDWKDRQVERMDPGGASFSMQNAGKATSKGLELETVWRAMAGLDLNASFGYTRAKYDDYQASPTEDYSGNWAIDSPRYTARVGATYRFQENWVVSAAYTRFGKTYYNPENTVSQSNYQTVDAKVGYEADNFEVYLWAKNIFNEQYMTRVVQQAGGSDWYARPGDPMTVGVNAAITF